MTPLIAHPLSMLTLGIGCILLLIWILYPKKGLLSYLRKTQTAQQKIELEDTLKFIYNCEYTNKKCLHTDLQKRLDISEEHVNNLIFNLKNMGLIQTNTQYELSLTETGRTYALRVIRVHRIWEQYLADETGVAHTLWHYQADKMEHHISQEQADEIAAKIGNPVFDPHGDPIPTQSGQMPQPKGKTLQLFEQGENIRITHIEDEPNDIYEQLILDGLYPGMSLYITDKSDNKIVFVADGEEIKLTTKFATQITAEQLPQSINIAADITTLATLDMDETAEIIGISNLCVGQQRRRLMDLGFVTGRKIKPIIKSSAGDPIGYNILGTTIGLRNQQAEQIFIKKTK